MGGKAFALACTRARRYTAAHTQTQTNTTAHAVTTCQCIFNQFSAARQHSVHGYARPDIHFRFRVMSVVLPEYQDRNACAAAGNSRPPKILRALWQAQTPRNNPDLKAHKFTLGHVINHQSPRPAVADAQAATHTPKITTTYSVQRVTGSRRKRHALVA